MPKGYSQRCLICRQPEKYGAEVWVKSSGLESILGIHLLESWKEIRLHRERGKNRSAEIRKIRGQEQKPSQTSSRETKKSGAQTT